MADQDAEVMLIGNKCDLSDQQVISKERGKLFAEENDIELFLETSAKDNINVKEVAFYQLAMYVLVSLFTIVSYCMIAYCC